MTHMVNEIRYRIFKLRMRNRAVNRAVKAVIEGGAA